MALARRHENDFAGGAGVDYARPRRGFHNVAGTSRLGAAGAGMHHFGLGRVPQRRPFWRCLCSDPKNK